MVDRAGVELSSRKPCRSLGVTAAEPLKTRKGPWAPVPRAVPMAEASVPSWGAPLGEISGGGPTCSLKGPSIQQTY